MAKKKSKEEKGKSEDVDAELRKLFGEDIMFMADQVNEEDRDIVRLSPVLDAALGGGLQSGTMCTFAGPAGCGKTTTVLRAALNWQLMGYEVYLFATEWRLFKRDLEHVEKLDASKVKVIRSTRDHLLTGEDVLKGIDKIVSSKTNTMVIVDSFSMLADKDELASDDYNQGAPASMNRKLSMFSKRMSGILPVNNNIIIGTFHIYANINGKTATVDAIPSKVKFFSSTRLLSTGFSVVRDGEEMTAKPLGQTVYWQVDRSMLKGGLTGQRVEGRITYGKGVDVSYELLHKCKALGLIERAGAWYTMSFLGDNAPKFQGENAVVEYLDSHTDIRDGLYKTYLDFVLPKSEDKDEGD